MLYNDLTSHSIVIILHVKNLVFLLKSTIKPIVYICLKAHFFVSFVKTKQNNPSNYKRAVSTLSAAGPA